MNKMREYIVVVTVRKVYKVQARTKADAVARDFTKLTPESTWEQSVYASWDRPPRLPAGYVALSLNFTPPE